MNSLTYTAVRETLAATMDRVCLDRDPVLITRNRDRDQAVVMISLEEYEALEETAHLLRSPANARRLIASVFDLAKGKGRRKKLSDLREK